MDYEVKEGDIYEFARKRNIRTRDRGEEILFQICPYCHGGTKPDLDTFSVNRVTGKFHCMRANCGVKGNMITLSRDFDFQLTDDFSNFHRREKTFRKLPQPREDIKPPPSYIVEYLNGRGISSETASAYKVVAHKKDESIMCFPIFDTEGIIVNVKYRNLKYTKDKKNGQKEWFEPNCKPFLYGVHTWNKSFSRMVLFEGQLDAMSGYEAGVRNCFSVPGGAKSFTWWPPSYEFCSKFKEIVIFGDYENGHITLLDELKQRYSGCLKHVRESDYRGCKDANEILLKYGKEQVRKCVENAVALPIIDVIDLADVEDVDVASLEKLSTGIKQLDDLLYGGLPFGGVHLIAGKSGHGKSTFASQMLVVALASGYRCFVYSGELPNYLFKAWINFQIAGGNHVFQSGDGIHENFGYGISATNKKLISEWYRGRAFIYDNASIDNAEHIGVIEASEKAIQQYGCRVILIDNLMTALDLESIRGDDKYEKQSQFVKKLARIAIRYNVIILLVAHKRKNSQGGQDEQYDVSGSGDISNLGMITLSYERDRKLSDSMRLLKVLKNRLFGNINTEGYVLHFDERSKRIYGSGDDQNREYGCFDEDGGFVPLPEDEIVFD